MKKIILLLSIILIISCATGKPDYKIVNDFLSEQQYKKSPDSIIISEQQYEKIHVIKIYETAYKERDNKGYKRVNVYPDITSWPIDEKELDALKRKISQESNGKWTKKDFDIKNIIIKNRDSFHDHDFFEKHIGIAQLVYVLSDPIYSADKKHALLMFTAMYFPYSSPLDGSGVILLEKRGDKWKKIAALSEDNYY